MQGAANAMSHDISPCFYLGSILSEYSTFIKLSVITQTKVQKKENHICENFHSVSVSSWFKNIGAVCCRHSSVCDI